MNKHFKLKNTAKPPHQLAEGLEELRNDAMKIIIVFIILFITVIASAQNDVLNDTIVKPVITELGKPDGEKAEMKIGKEGGSLKSSDGKVELVFPAGALTKNTNIIIQPVTNMAPNGAGKAYWFEPSGIQFKKPVQIIINYTDEEAEICPPDLMGLAIQNKQGQWSFIDYNSWDSTAKLLKGSITHFSGAGNVNKMMLIPNYKRIKVNTKLEVRLLNISSWFEPNYGESDDDFFLPPAYVSDGRTTLWYVNEIEGGNGPRRDGFIFQYMKTGAVYEAPSRLPEINPVTVKVELYIIKKNRKGKTLNLIKTFTSKIHIYDKVYEVIMTSDIDLPSGDGSVTYRDTGSFVVSLNGKETKIIEKINKNANDEFNYEFAGCKSKTIKPGSGYIHMVGVPVITVTPATPTQPTRVKIEFIRTKLILPVLEYTCTDRKGKTFTGTTEQMNAIMSMMNAYPQSIEFTAREGEEEWEIYETGFAIREGVHIQGKTLLKYIIRRLKDDE
jgi:hypothetical protein